METKRISATVALKSLMISFERSASSARRSYRFIRRRMASIRLMGSRGRRGFFLTPITPVPVEQPRVEPPRVEPPRVKAPRAPARPAATRRPQGEGWERPVAAGTGVRAGRTRGPIRPAARRHLTSCGLTQWIWKYVGSVMTFCQIAGSLRSQSGGSPPPPLSGGLLGGAGACEHVPSGLAW